jgi:RNA polymerase primary sigma factor
LQEGGRAPTFEEIASSLQLTHVQKILVSQALRVGHVKLGANYSAESGIWLAESASDRRPPSAYFLESDEDSVSAARRMDRLDPRERAVLTLRFGLEGEFLTRKEIGRRLGMTGEGARKVELRALRKLSDDRCDRTIGGYVAS